MPVILRWVALGVVGLLPPLPGRATTPAGTEFLLPRFTEEREAAALCFLRKNASELLTMLDRLKKENPTRYQQEIRAVFQVAEMLADLEDNPPRHDLELQIWKLESRAHTLASRLPGQPENERRQTEAELHKMARQLVELDTRVLELKTEQAEKELSELRDELTKAREQAPARLKARYDNLIDQGRKRRKS